VGRVDGRVLVPAWSDPWTAPHAELAQIRRERGDGREVARAFLENGDTTAAVQPLVHLHSRVEEVSSPSVEEFVQLVRREFERAEALTESQRVAGAPPSP
jgi:hypothetical protein